MPTTIPIERLADAIVLMGTSLDELPGVNGAYRELMAVIERVAATPKDMLDLEGVACDYNCIAATEEAVVALEVGRRFGAAGVLLDEVTVEGLGGMLADVAEGRIADEVRRIFGEVEL